MIEPLLQAERLLLHGLVDQAEQIYRRTLDNDPRNAIAAVGLAKVALERDDFQQAYEHACHALTIDRENPSALRLEARLSEVLHARGEPVERPSWLDTGRPPERPPEPPAAPQAADAPAPAELDGGAERAVFARNRSMADHRRMDDAHPAPAADTPTPRQPDTSAADQPGMSADDHSATGAPRRGLLRRLLGR
jgi:tetratricopeptide (TPR) repeat protein